MFSFSLRRTLPILLHAFLWGLMALLLSFHPPIADTELLHRFELKQGLVLLMLMGLFYFNTLVAVPRLLFRRRVGAYIGLSVAAVATVLALHGQLELRLNLTHALRPAPRQLPFRGERRNPAFRNLNARGNRNPQPWRMWVNPMVSLMALLVLGAGTSIEAVRKAQLDAERRQELEQEKVAAELSMLKAQLNPHFFFNTLNNIYALTLLDGEQARTALHRLSRMMRYVLYETQAGPVQLSQEITFLQDYIELMQLRLTDRVSVTFERPEPLLHDVPVAPLLFLSFVENAFKHGVSATQSSHVRVVVRQPSAGRLEVEVRNTLFEAKAPTLDEGGIGLTNTRRRLALLYPDRHTLRITESTVEQEYVVHLTLLLSATADAPLAT